MFCGDTSRCTSSSGSPRSFRASCAACSPWRNPATIATAMRGSIGSPARAAYFTSFESDSPGMYSMTRKSSPSRATTSSVETTFGWWMRAATRASSMNIATNSGSFANCAWRRLIATVRENPACPSSRP